MNLVIVESPTKAKTITKFLAKGFTVKSSYGHLRDLPKNRLGIDVKNDFQPTYVVEPNNKKTVSDLKALADKAKLVYFATDEDREGEAIAWHLKQLLKTPDEKSKRITFHEITKEAILESIKNPRDINENLVNAQQARRILDRIVGYQLSPFLWRKVAKGLSAGRVQSVALRLVVEREKEILAFKTQEYWTVEASFRTKDGKEFTTNLVKFNSETIKKMDIGGEDLAGSIVKSLKNDAFTISDVIKKETHRSPQAPFTTSSIQQDANRILGFTAKQTMKIAQELYEGVELGGEGSVGLITYMRTDSLNLSTKFKEEAKKFIEKTFDKDYIPEEARVYKNKSKIAQEAHEAIRPSDVEKVPEQIGNYLTPNQFKLYTLIWQRALASQMSDAILDTTAVEVVNTTKSTLLRANGSTIKFYGFLKIYPTEMKEMILPYLTSGDKLTLLETLPKQHFTEPPPRYNDASLVKALEQYDIGRPSTYAPTISTIIDRNYVNRINNRNLGPTDLGMLVNDILTEHFPEIVDYSFTAKMEDNLDEVASGGKEWVPVLKEFYEPFSEHLAKKEKEVTREVLKEVTEEICKNCSKPMVVRMSRYGKFLACSGFPECRYTTQLPGDKNKATAEAGDKDKKGYKLISEEELEGKKCAKCGGAMDEKLGRFGAYYKCAKCSATETKVISVGVQCPECGQGEILERRTGRGRTFYSCNRYPNCKFALWNKPTGEKCLKCSSLLVTTIKGQVKCSSKGCDYKLET